MMQPQFMGFLIDFVERKYRVDSGESDEEVYVWQGYFYAGLQSDERKTPSFLPFPPSTGLLGGGAGELGLVQARPPTSRPVLAPILIFDFFASRY